MAGGGIREQTLSGVRWVAGVRVFRQLAEFTLVAVLARLLTPADFGLVGMVLVFSNLSWVLTEAGFIAALVQRESLHTRHLHTAFWLVSGLSLTIAIMFVLGAPLLAALYETPELAPVAAAMSLNLLAGGLGVVPVARLQRAMAFRGLSIMEACATVAGGLLAVTMALHGMGVWSLVAQVIAVPALRSAGCWVLAGWRPRLRFDLRAARELARVSVPLMGTNLLGYAHRNLDKLLIGRFLGAAALGVYGRAYNVMLMPLLHITYVTQNVMLASLSRMQSDHARVRAAYLRAVGVLALVTMPAMAGLLAVADVFVPTVFGGQWTAMVPVLQVLCIVGLVQPVSATAGWLFISQGRTDLQLLWNLFTTPTFVAAFAIGLKWGITGVAGAYALVNCLLWYPQMRLAGRLVGLRMPEFLAVLRGPALCSALMALAVAFTGTLLPAEWPAPVHLIMLVALGVLLYGGLAHLARLEAYGDLLELARLRRPGRRAEARPS